MNRNNNSHNNTDPGKNLQIIQWNARSIRNSTSDLKLSAYTIRPHIIALQETWLDSRDKDPAFIAYDTIRADRGGGSGKMRGEGEGEDSC